LGRPIGSLRDDQLTDAVRRPRSSLGSVSEASRSTPAPVVGIIDDGMTDQEIAANTQAWLAELRELPIIDIGVSAAETLDELYADGEL